MRLGVREVARLFDVSERTVYRWIREDELPAHEVEGQSRFHRAEVLEWATARDITPSPELFEEDASSPATSIAAALERGGVHVGLAAASRDEALGAIVAHLPISEDDRSVVAAVLAARPDLGKTSAGDGIALPHVRNPIVLDVPHPSVTLCFFADPIAWSSGAPRIHTVFTLVVPTVPTHLAMLSRLAFDVHEAGVRRALETRDPAAILAALRDLEARPPGPPMDADAPV